MDHPPVVDPQAVRKEHPAAPAVPALAQCSGLPAVVTPAAPGRRMTQDGTTWRMEHRSPTTGAASATTEKTAGISSTVKA